MPRTSSAELAQLTNEAEYWGAISEGATPEQATKRMPYSQTDIDLYANGTDPYGHPNTDWNKLFFVGSGFTNRHNVSVGGGTEWVNYRTSLFDSGAYKSDILGFGNKRTDLPPSK